MYKILLPIALLAMVIASASCSGGGSGSGDDDTAAVVNGTKITVKDVDRAIAASMQQPGVVDQLSQIELAGARLQGLSKLIDQEVLFQRAQKEGIAPSDDEIKNFIQQKKQERNMTEDDFNKYLKQINQTEDQLKDDVKKQKSIEKLVEKHQLQLKVKDSEVQDFYKADPKAFTLKPGVYLSDIIIDPGTNGTKIDAVGEVDAKVRVDDIHTRLKAGNSDFASLARQFSEDQTALQSGDLGLLLQEEFNNLPSRMGLPASIGDRLMAMKEGDFTEPLKDSAGRWHVLKLTGKITEARDRNLDDPQVKQSISNAIMEQRKAIVIAALQASARDEAKIENYLAQKMLQNPNNFGALRPAPGKASAAK